MPLWLEAIHVISLIRLENAASRRVAQKLGRELEGTTEIFGSEAVVYGISRETGSNVEEDDSFRTAS